MSAPRTRRWRSVTLLSGVAALCAAAALAGVPAWLCAAPLLVVGVSLLVSLRRAARRSTPRRTRLADERATRDAVLHRLQPLAPRAATPQAPAPLSPRRMLWERPARRA